MTWIIYLLAIVSANLITAEFAPTFPQVTVIVAFVFIGLDLSLRDYLHDSWVDRGLLPKMGLLIISGSAIAYLINQDAGMVALGSSVAFLLASLTDAAVYHTFINRKYLIRANVSNIAGAFVDSLIFPLIALSFLPPETLVGIIALQFLAKTAGGSVWSIVINALRRRFPTVTP